MKPIAYIFIGLIIGIYLTEGRSIAVPEARIEMPFTVVHEVDFSQVDDIGLVHLNLEDIEGLINDP